MLNYPVDPYFNYIPTFQQTALSDVDYSILFAKVISSYSTVNVKKGNAIFVAGQPGSGKNHLIANNLSTILKVNNIVPYNINDYQIVDHDDWREHHRCFPSLTLQDSLSASLNLQADIDKLERDVLSFLADKRVNIIISDGAFGVYARTHKYLEVLKKNDYDIHLVFIAMDLKNSEVNVRNRYEKSIISDNPRWVLHEIQQGVYNNTIDCLLQLDLENFKTLSVVDRKHEQLTMHNPFSNSSLIALIQDERNRPYTREEFRSYYLNWQDILQMVTKRSSDITEVNKIKKILERAKSDYYNFVDN